MPDDRFRSIDAERFYRAVFGWTTLDLGSGELWTPVSGGVDVVAPSAGRASAASDGTKKHSPARTRARMACPSHSLV